MIEGQLIARRVNNDPPGYRVIFQQVEVGSISLLSAAGKPNAWCWALDTMPLLDHAGRPPYGEAATFQTALDAFRKAFLEWPSPDKWPKKHRLLATSGDS